MSAIGSNPVARGLVRWSRRLAVPCAAVAAAQAQTTFSIDYRGPTISWPDSAGMIPITEADILVAPTWIPALGPSSVRPSTWINGGPFGGLGLALYPACVGHPAGLPCGVEVDALSYGFDGPALPAAPAGVWWFSVDERAVGLFAAALPPNLVTEGAAGAREAAADVFNYAGALPAGPLPPLAVPPLSMLAIDGNGFRSAALFAARGVALIEWNPPGPPPQLGDNLDALDVDLPPLMQPPLYFSLDSAFIDPASGLPNSGSAVLHGFVGGDVLVCNAPGAPPAVYAPAVALGLDRMGVPDSDDLDALAVFENGLPGFQVPSGPYSWLGGSDMLLFSVRRGSLVIGAPDSLLGLPIEEGDVLMPPAVGGLSPFPGILIAAENLGLATRRATGGMHSDDLDGLDVTLMPVFDCNANGIEDVADICGGLALDLNATGIPDTCDITLGASNDINGNGVPDECELCNAAVYCVAKVNSIGCTPMIGAFGTPSATALKPFLISAVDTASVQNGLMFYGFAAAAAPFKGGTRCVANPLTRCLPVLSSGGVWPPTNCSGVFSYDFNARIKSGVDPNLMPGVIVFAQYWYRNPGSSFNVGLTDALRFSICP